MDVDQPLGLAHWKLGPQGGGLGKWWNFTDVEPHERSLGLWGSCPCNELRKLLRGSEALVRVNCYKNKLHP